jgi:hypothetical protein
VERAGGLGHLLAQQLLAAGERVLDVPPKLAARVRLLESGDMNKNDPNDARSMAVAALRSKVRRQVATPSTPACWPTPARPLRGERQRLRPRTHAEPLDTKRIRSARFDRSCESGSGEADVGVLYLPLRAWSRLGLRPGAADAVALPARWCLANAA